MRPLRFISFGVIAGCGLTIGSWAQTGTVPSSSFAGSTSSEFAITRVTSSLSPDLALTAYEKGLQSQSNELTGYTAITVVDAELPDSSQKARFELKRHYVAPSLLEFTPLNSTGDKFVKSNVIARLLQSEVDHVQKREQSQTAIDSDNYKFNYKGTSELNGVPVHVYDVKPRKKRVGLFKGKIFLESLSGHLLRAQGAIVKSPSFFIKKIKFTQDYANVAGFTLPTHLHSEAETRLVGKTVVDVVHRDYEPEASRSNPSGVALLGCAN